MYRKWITNVDRSRAKKVRDDIESYTRKVCLIGRPLTVGSLPVTELEAMNCVGIYMETPDNKVKPDPNCPNCKGTGMVTLLTSSAPCECLKRLEEVDDEYDVCWE